VIAPTSAQSTQHSDLPDTRILDASHKFEASRLAGLPDCTMNERRTKVNRIGHAPTTCRAYGATIAFTTIGPPACRAFTHPVYRFSNTVT
jgi:hypothetical protein